MKTIVAFVVLTCFSDDEPSSLPLHLLEDVDGGVGPELASALGGADVAAEACLIAALVKRLVGGNVARGAVGEADDHCLREGGTRLDVQSDFDEHLAVQPRNAQVVHAQGVDGDRVLLRKVLQQY